VAATASTTAAAAASTAAAAFVLIFTGLDAGADHQDQNKNQGRRGLGQKLQGRLF
jgi:hypothetical protein